MTTHIAVLMKLTGMARLTVANAQVGQLCESLCETFTPSCTK